jgi:hypothetical protein
MLYSINKNSQHIVGNRSISGSGVLNNGNSEMTNEMIERIMREEIQKRLDMYFEGSSNVLEQIKGEEVQSAQSDVKKTKPYNGRIGRSYKYEQLLDIPLYGSLFIKCQPNELAITQQAWAPYASRVGNKQNRKFKTSQNKAKSGVDIIRVA